MKYIFLAIVASIVLALFNTVQAYPLECKSRPLIFGFPSRMLGKGGLGSPNCQVAHPVIDLRSF
ncbi:hypothetical protein D3C87_258090 [compost metagenome]